MQRVYIANQAAADRALIESVLSVRGLSLWDFMRPSYLHTVRYILTCWGLVILGVTLSFHGGTGGFGTASAIVIFGFAQYAMLMLTHEASHLGLTRWRSLNSFLGNLFFALPIGQTVASYTVAHVPHHAKLNTPEDTAYYLTNPEFSRAQVEELLGLTLRG